MLANLQTLIERDVPANATPDENPPSASTILRRRCFEAVINEFNPIGFSETLLARNAARDAAEILRNEQLSDAIEVLSNRALTALMMPLGDHQQLPGSLCASERLNELSRSGARSAAAFYRSLEQLAEIQRRRANIEAALEEPDVRFGTELQCITYLARRFQRGHQVCRRCGLPGHGNWIAVRRVWDCTACHVQTCARQGTVMARSRVPLKVWFHAIRVLLIQPNISVAALAKAVGVRRLPTVRTIAQKVRAAMMADEASSLLAGLDRVFLPLLE